MSEIVTHRQGFDLTPQTFEQALTFSNYLAESDMVPKDYKGKPGNCLIAMQWGAEIGLKPLQALQGIAVMNGRPAIWGDAMLALVRSSPLCEYVRESFEQDGTAVCRVKRRGDDEQVSTFSDADAKLAGLLGKQGPWTTSPRRMKQMRARAFALRDVFTDVLKGIQMAEEAMDTPPAEKFMGAADVVPTQPQKPSLPAYSTEDFAKNLPAWSALVADGKKTAADLLAMLSTRAMFSDEQQKQILALQPAASDGGEP